MAGFLGELGEAINDFLDDFFYGNVMGGDKKLLDTDRRCTIALIIIVILVIIISIIGIIKLWQNIF